MRIAIISDIHSNLAALEAVLNDIASKKIDKIYCLGDVIGYGPYPKECLEQVKKTCQEIIKGNHENSLELLDLGESHLRKVALLGVRFSKGKLSEEEINFLSGLPTSKIIEDLGLTLCHGAFTEPQIWKYIEEEDEAKNELANIPTRICLLGHTHIPFLFGSNSGLSEELPDDLVLKQDEKYIINVGSVGQPRDDDCRASYVILEYSAEQVIFNLQRVFYDISQTEKAILAAGLPKYLAERLFRGE